jgi:hypothetical protein
LVFTAKASLASFIGNPHYGKSYGVKVNHAHERR